MFLNEMKKFINQFVLVRYKNVFSIKMPNKVYYGDAECFYIAGALSVCEDIFNKNKNEQFVNKDDVMASLHLIYLECYNDFRVKYGYKVCDKVTLEKPINLSEKTDEKEITFC